MNLSIFAAVAASSSNSDDIGAGVIAFLIVAAMGVALVFLLRSMNTQLRKITPAPGDTEGEQAKDPADTPR